MFQKITIKLASSISSPGKVLEHLMSLRNSASFINFLVDMKRIAESTGVSPEIKLEFPCFRLRCQK